MTAIFGVCGAVVGSFLVLAGLRLPRGEPLFRPRSHCDKCGHILSWYELVPVLSWVWLGGRCRACREPIPPWVPLLEGSMGASWALCWGHFHWGPGFVLGIFISGVLGLMAAIDLGVQRVPNWLIGVGTAGIVIARLFVHSLPWWNYVAGAVLGMALLLLLRVIGRGGMGMGDVKLFGWVGLTLGIWGMLTTLIWASLFAALFGTLQMVGGRLRRDQWIPFGPWIGLAMMTVYLYGRF